MSEIKLYTIVPKEKNIRIDAFWNDKLHAAIKSRGGKWIPNSKQWEIDNEHTNDISRVLSNIYGLQSALTIQLTIKNYKVYRTLRIFDRNIIEINQFDNIYKVDYSAEIIDGDFPSKWSLISQNDFYTTKFTGYFMQKIAGFINPFIIKDVTIIINNVGTEQLERLQLRNHAYIKKIKKL